MHRRLNPVVVLARMALGLAAVALAAPVSAQDDGLPADVRADSRSRLPMIDPDGPPGVAAIRLHASGADARWASPLGRPLTELAVLVTAREHDQQYEWSLHETEALAVGLDPAVIDLVRHRRPLEGIGDRERVVIEMGRELYGTHRLSSATYARAVNLLGRGNLVDLVDLMARYTGTAARLTAFNQQMPPGWTEFLPLPFTPSSDIHADSRSRLPLIRSEPQDPPAELYGRLLSPEGTGPRHILRHGAGLASLEASVGRRMMTLAILVTARAHDAQYQWTVNEPAALSAGLEPAIVDAVRHRAPLEGLPAPEAALIAFGRELFGRHDVRADTYARAVQAFGERDLVDLVTLMAQHAGEAVLLAAFDQHLPAGQPPRLP